MIAATVLGAAGIAFGLLTNHPGDTFIGFCLLGLVFICVLERDWKRNKGASDHLRLEGQMRIGLAQMLEDDERKRDVA